jgi:hypothetical protein
MRHGDEAPKDAKFCAIELQDGAFGLSYVLLGDTLDALTGARSGHSGERLAGADPLQLARRLDGRQPGGASPGSGRHQRADRLRLAPGGLPAAAGGATPWAMCS